MDPEQPRPPPRLIRLLTRHRRALSLAGALWLGLVIGGGIFLSRMDARVGLHVFGPQTWVAAEPGVLRVTLRDLKFNRYEALGAVHATFVEAEGARGPRQALTDRAGHYVQGSVRPPRHPGRYRLELDAESEHGPLLAQMSVLVTGRAPVSPLPAPSPHPPPVPDVGPLTLDLQPTDQVLTGGGLPTTVTVRATDAAGRPASVQIELTMKEGRSALPVPTRVHTDRDGLASFAVAPQHPTFWWNLQAGDSHAARRLRYTPTQFVLDTPHSLVAPGSTLALDLRSLHTSAPVFVDLWRGDRWLATGAGVLSQGETRLQLAVPQLDEDPALIWVQAYKDAYLPQQARGGLHLVVSRRPLRAVTRWLAGELARAGLATPYSAHMAEAADDNPALLRYLLGRIPRPDRDPPLLADSGLTARQTVDSLKAVWRGRFVWALLLSGLALFLLLGWLVWHNHRDVQRRWVLAGGAEHGDRGTRDHALLDAGYMFLVIALFLLGLVEMVLTIRW